MKIIVPKIETEASSSSADNSPQAFKIGTTDFGDPCAETDPGQALAIFYKDVENPDYSIKDFDVDLKVKITPDVLSSSLFYSYAYWSKATGPGSGILSASVGHGVKFQNPKEGGLYKFGCALVGSGFPTSGANVLLPLGGPDVTTYLLNEVKRYDNWLSIMKPRIFAYSDDEVTRGWLITLYFSKTAYAMDHKLATYEIGDSPCRSCCRDTVTIAGHVFRKDIIGNFLYGYLAARTEYNLGTTQFAAHLISILQSKSLDGPDDQEACAVGHAFGLNPNGDFKIILETFDIPIMQNESAKHGWPSTDITTGTQYPTWGMTPGIFTPD